MNRIFSLITFFLISQIISCYNQEVKKDTLGYVKDDFNLNLLIAADKGLTADVVWFLDKGADINTSVQDGITALMYAVLNNHYETAKTLVEKKASLDLFNDYGENALIIAVKNNNEDIAELLIRNNAKIDTSGIYNITPLMYAISNGNFVLTDMLLYYGADFNHTDKQRTNAIMLSSYLGYIDIVETLIEQGADVNSRDANGNTPLHMAVQNGYIDIAELLVENGANLNLQNKNGYTPLAFAVELNDVEMTEYLVSEGASVNQYVTPSMSPLDIAKGNKNDSLITVLKKHHARSTYFPIFNKFFLGPGIVFNPDDFFSGLNFGMSDKKYNIDLSVDYSFRPFKTRVLEQEDSVTFYQYWERRAIWSIGIEKRFRLTSLSNYSDFGLIAGVKESFTFGSYRATKVKPEVAYLTVPGAGVYITSPGIRLKLTYEFMDLNLYRFQRGWINFSLSFLINRKINKFTPKHIDWY